MNQKIFDRYLSGRKVAILGFGREGVSTYQVIRRLLPAFPLVVCDRNENLLKNAAFLQGDTHSELFYGPDYLQGLRGAELIVKSPGISFRELEGMQLSGRVTSQTEMFLELFGSQVTGITGTKGKSTTTSLLYHILQQSGISCLMAGNIGIPPMDLVSQMRDDTRVIFEMSSHQLEHVKMSPHVAILLNIFQEHLDHYESYQHYQEAKMNIARWQQTGDFFICNLENPVIASQLQKIDLPARLISLGCSHTNDSFACFRQHDLHVVINRQQHIIPGIGLERRLAGKHNLVNIAAACAAALLGGASPEGISRGVASFNGLAHRMEYLGDVAGVGFYNDSIATIPEAAMEAINSLPATHSLILGGVDRGVDYAPFIEYLEHSPVQVFFFMGDAGRKMLSLAKNRVGFSSKTLQEVWGLQEAFQRARQLTPRGKICLLSPAAASYDTFRNFEERGDLLRKLVQQEKPIQ